MKKLFCIAVSVAILLQMFIPTGFAAEVYAASEEAVQLLNALGIMNSSEAESSADTKLSRGEFSVYLGRIAGVQENASAPDVRYFIDVAQNSRFAPSVTMLYEQGIVKGTEDKLFEPDAPVKPFDAAVMMLRLGGYEDYVTVGADYAKLIAQNRLLDGIGGDGLTTAQAADLIFKALKMPYFNITSYGDDLSFSIDENHTLMYEFYNVYEIEGIIECAEGISLKEEFVEDGKVIVGGEVYTAENIYAYEDLGCLVTGYVIEDANGMSELIAYGVLPSVKIMEIDIDKIVSVTDSGLTIKYYKDDLDKIYTVNLPGNMNVLKNGKRVTKDIEKAFDEKQGSIKITEVPKYGTTVSINVYDSVFVSNNDIETGMIYAKAGEKIDVSQASIERIRIYLSNGSIGALSDIRKGMLLTVYRSDVSIEMHICADTVSGVIEAKNEKEVTVNGSKYEVEPELYDKMFDKILVGAEYEFYLNKFHEIAYFTYASAKGEIGFIIDAVADPGVFTEELLFRMMLSDGRVETLKASDKTELNGEAKKIGEIIESLEKTGVSGRAQLVSYTMDEENKIRAIYTSADEGSDRRIRLDSDFSEKYHKFTPRTLGNDVALKQDVVIFKIPEITKLKTANIKEYEIMPRLEDNTSYYCAAYSLGGESFMSDVIVVSSNDVISDFNGQEHVWMFDSSYTDLDEEGMERTKIILAGVKRDGDYMKIEEFIIPEEFEVTEANRLLGDVSWNELTRGDLIWIKHNTADEIMRIRMAFDHDKEGVTVADCSHKAEYPESLGRFAAGYATSKEELFVGLGMTTPFKRDEIAYMVEGVIAVYDSTARKDKVYVGTINDIMTYDEVGDAASVVVPVTWYKWSRMIFVYKNGL